MLISAVFDLSIIINYRKFQSQLGKRKHEKLKETGAISNNSKYERRMLKIEDIPFQKRTMLQTLVRLGGKSCHPAVQTSADVVNFESIDHLKPVSILFF